MINIKRPKSKTALMAEAASEHLFTIAAGLCGVLILGLGTYIVVKSNSVKTSGGSVAGIQIDKTEESETDLLNTVAQGSNYKYFFDALTKTGLYNTLKGEEVYTILVPSDSAFKAMGGSELNKLFANKDRLTKLIQNHIINGKLNRLDFDKVEFMKADSGRLITIKKTDLGTLFNNSKLMSSGTEATNGIIYEIDSLIL